MSRITEILKVKKMKGYNWEEISSVLPISSAGLRAAFSRGSVDDVYLDAIENYLKIENKSEAGEAPISLNFKKVPYYDIDFTAGFLEVENNQNTVPDSYISHPFFLNCDYVVRASGQSMAKIIRHGDAIGLIKLNNWREFLPFGEVYAIVTNDGLRMIKVITKGDDDTKFKLISKPSESKKDEFPPQQIKKSSIVAVFKVQATSHLF